MLIGIDTLAHFYAAWKVVVLKQGCLRHCISLTNFEGPLYASVHGVLYARRDVDCGLQWDLA